MIPVPRSIARIPILRGLFRLAITGYARLTRGRFMVEKRMDLRLLIDLENTIDRSIFLSGTWEKEHLERRGPTVAPRRRTSNRHRRI